MDRFVTTDETPWLMRSGNFYFALGQRDFIKTDQNKSPGVTTMWINTVAYLIEAPQYRGFGQGYFRHYVDFDAFVISKNIDAHAILVTGRRIFVAINLFLFLVALLFSIRLIGILPSVVGFAFIATDPFNIALTKVAHMDGLLGGLMLVSILAFLYYLFKGRKWFPFLTSAFFASLACLTKLPGYLIIPFFLLLVLIYELKDRKKARMQPDPIQPRKKLLTHAIVWGVTFIGFFVLLWPAMWISPIKMAVEQISAPFIFLPEEESEIDTSPTLTGESNLFQKITREASRYPKAFLWQTTPLTLLGLLVLIPVAIKKKGFFSNEDFRRFSGALLLFVLFYLVGITIVSKSNPRYMIPAYNVLLLLSAFGWISTVQWINQSISSKIIKFVSFGVISAITVFTLISAMLTYPYFYSYYNPIMGGSAKAGATKFIGSGEGLDQAARYLNTKPDAEHLTAMSWYGSGCFSYFFDGKTIIIPTGIGDDYIFDHLNKADYIVVYTNQWFRRIPPELFNVLDGITPEKEIWINGIEYARVYSVDQLPLQYREKAK